MSDYERKLQLAATKLQAAGWQKSPKPTPDVRVLRYFGFEPRPFAYRSRVARITFGLLLFGGGWGTGMFIMSNTVQCNASRLVIGSILIGAILTLYAEYGVWRYRKKLQVKPLGRPMIG
ncbi:DUF6404 family protein [Ruegeria arenilitoris]|uniref:DUF6404 family protein n=1 Tax=Ruegeria arenilitoris TaxID=1173585 RepID=UPI003464B7B6